jgi:phage baseplate assembly protein gpV
MNGGELERLVVEIAELTRNRFYGKYRGIVQDVDDTKKLGRLRALVPEVYGDEVSPWALPCVPFAGAKHGMVWLPEPNDGVWIEFEAGDPARPIWCGGWWGKGDLETDLNKHTTRALVTSAGHRVTLDDDGKKVSVEHSAGGKVEITDSTMTLECKSGKVELSASGVAINGTSLTVK